MYGDYKANFIKTVELLRNFNNFLTVVIFLGVWNGITLCFTWKSGNEPYDFLICSCCKNVIGAFFQLVYMALFAIPFLYGIKEDFFCPWS